jgi:hypothetical protein
VTLRSEIEALGIGSTLTLTSKGAQMQRSTMVRMGAVGVVCAIAGGAAGIAGSSASSSHPAKSADAGAGIDPGPGPLLGLGLGDAAGPPVHADAVVPNEKGGFDTVTMDRGAFSALSGDQLTIAEGTKKTTYKSVTLTIPSSATVRRNGQAAHLSDLKSGDTVLVAQTPKGTVVAAHDAQHAEQMGLKFRAFGHGEMPRPPKPPATPEEGASSGSSEGAAAGAQVGSPS